MIQRIQSLFLLLAAAATFGLFGLPFATTSEEVVASEIFADSRYDLMDNVGLLVFFGIGGLLALVSIFLFRNRRLQMRLTILAFVLNLVGIIFGVIYFMQNSGATSEAKVDDGLGLYAAGAAVVLLLLAYRFIGKDEKLVKSMDRLR